MTIAQRHLEQVTAATLLASTPEHDQASLEAAARRRPTRCRAHRDLPRAPTGALVERPGFAAFFQAATPDRPDPGPRPRLTAGLAAGAGRPAAAAPRRNRRAARDPVGLRLVAVAGQPARLVRPRHGARGDHRPRWLRGRASTWPRSTAAGRSSPRCWTTPSSRSPRRTSARSARYADLATGREATAIRGMIEAEFARSIRLLLLVTGRERLLAGHAMLARSIDLRNPYIDALSAIQVELLGPAAAGRRAARRGRDSARRRRCDDQRDRGGAPEHRLTEDECATSRRPSSSPPGVAPVIETLRLDEPHAGEVLSA